MYLIYWAVQKTNKHVNTVSLFLLCNPLIDVIDLDWISSI